ncbi:MAG: hypothetical protein L6Q55_12460 [Azonexus sp.]|nr:hypothetical protein [Azonexus sp.]MCK6413222.1 hypothetical protein [Azonexus sp.]
MTLIAAYGLLAHGLIFGAFAALLPLGEFRPRVGLAATTIALIGGIAPALHGIFGAPSPTLLLLALLQLANRTPSPLTWPIARGLLLFAPWFYLPALGAGAFDPYALGYQPWPLLAALIPVGAVLFWKRQTPWLAILAVDLASYAIGIHGNLWDALFDPLLLLLAFGFACRQAYLAFRLRKQAARA